jgi:hypothetical protein
MAIHNTWEDKLAGRVDYLRTGIGFEILANRRNLAVSDQ